MTSRLPGPSDDDQKLLLDKKAFFEALGRAESQAIRLLSQKIIYELKDATAQAQLTSEDAEELLNDAIVVTISNIRNGKFVFSDISPVAYAKGVVRKLIANHLRTKKPRKKELEDSDALSDFDPFAYLEDKERQAVVGQLLKRLGENCHNLLVMKFFSHLKDEEIITQGLAPYTSVGSLKSKRSQCLKKLAELARQAGILEVF